MIKRILLRLSIILIIFLVPSLSIQTKENINKSRFVKDQLIIKLKKDHISAAGEQKFISYSDRIKAISSEYNIPLKKSKILFPASVNNFYLYEKYELGTYFVINTEPGMDVQDMCSTFEKSAYVDYAEPDFIGEAAGKSSEFTKPSLKPNDEFFYRQWGLSNDGSVKTTTGRSGVPGGDMNILKGWEIDRGSESTIVAILDSGVKLDHPELAGRLWVNQTESRNGRDDDGNGFVDDINGWNFAYDNSNIKDDGGHGSNIAGTIGANTDNSIGFAGIDQRCRLMICKNLDDENLGEYSWWAASLYYAAKNGARVINMSEGGYDYSKTLATAVNYAYESGCLICASMMNKNNGDDYYPACLTNIMAIGATDTDDSRCREFTWGGGSNWGKHIAVVAPGNRIYGLDFKDNTNYEVYWSGTSQATAYVTAIASVLISQDPGRTNRQLRDIITSSAADQVGDPREDTPGWDEYYGYGRVDLYAALTNSKPSNERINNDRDKEEPVKTQEEIKNDEGDSKRAKALDPNDKSKQDDNKRAKRIDH